jgi:hypothetical protein
MPGRKSLFVIALISFLTAIHLQADCSPTVVVRVPATACKSGTATASVIAVPGATYAWTVDGGQIASDAASDHITIVLGTNAKATASVTVTAGDCVSRGNGVIALHDPFSVRVITIPAARAGEPLTILWAYDNGTPAQQTISGDFGLATLAADGRSYTYTPQKSGSKQFVVDAVMKMPAAPPPPVSRQRAVSKGTVIAASPCTVAHAAASYSVGECAVPSVVIAGPASVVSAATFELSVAHQAGAVATWTITNAFPATATGDSVMVTAGPSGEIGVTARLTRGACSDALDRSIAITAKPACDNPKAAVSTGPLSCGSAFLNASFIGTPPFKGKWSDNVAFDTSATSVIRTVTMPGNYTIIHFEDATCEGTSSGVAVVPALYPSATISGRAISCTGVDTATVRFTGKPPFSACWLDGTCFQTDQMEITKPITAAGTNTLASGSDGNGCPLTIVGAVQAFLSQHVGLSRRCEWGPTFGNVANLFVFYHGYFYGPNAVTWSDGVKSGSGRYGVNPSQTTTYSVAGITESGSSVCATIWDTSRSITVYPNPVPEFTSSDTGDLCPGSTGTTTLATPPPPGTQVQWTVQNGAIISGQGTSSVQYQAGSSSGMNVICTFIFADPDRCPLTTQRSRGFLPPEPYATIEVDRREFHVANKTVEVNFRLDSSVTNWSITNSMNDTITPSGPCTPNGSQCWAIYTSTHGPGQSTITLHAINACNTKDVSTVLTILP